MGVYRRGKIWYIRYQGPDGSDIRESTGQESKRLAEKILGKRKTEIAEERFLDRQERPRMTLSELCDWYWLHHGQYLKWQGVQGMLLRFKRFFGNRPLVSVTAELIGEYVQERRSRDHVKPRTTNRDLQLLKLMFNRVIDAKRWAKVLENPVCYVKLASETDQRVRYLDQEEIRSLIDACDEHIRPIVLTALRTGMRRGELFNLRWSDVNLKKRFLFIRQSKNGEGRHVPISDDLARVMISLKSRAKRGHVFPSYLPRRGSRASGDATQPFVDIKNSFRQALKAAGIRDFRFHHLRHTFASHLVMQGVDLNTVRELLGHKGLQMTLRYAHLSPAHNLGAIQLIDKALGPVGSCATGTPTGTATILRFRRSS
jgi:integrase